MSNTISENRIRVVTLGELLIDFTSVSVDSDGYPTLSAHPGGAPANFLGTLAKLGVKTAMTGKVGDDTFGHLLVNTLASLGVDTSNLIKDKSVFTTLAFVTLDNNGNRDFAFSRKPGADTQISFDEIDLSLIDECDIFHFGSLSLTDDPSRTATYKTVEYAKNKGKIISFDPNLRRPLWNNLNEAKKQILWGLENADIVKISDDEVAFLFGINPADGAEYIINNFGAKLVFVTCGENGCYYANRNGKGYTPAMKDINVIDTTGAGDIFAGSMIYGVLESGKKPEDLSFDELVKIAESGVRFAGLSTQKYGGISSIPDKKEFFKEVLC